MKMGLQKLPHLLMQKISIEERVRFYLYLAPCPFLSKLREASSAGRPTLK